MQTPQPSPSPSTTTTKMFTTTTPPMNNHPSTTVPKLPKRITSTSFSLTITNSSSSSSKPIPPAGRIRRLVLTPKDRVKLDPSPDREFYSFPRFVKHVDDAFLGTLTSLYRERVPQGSDVLDLMSSWVSHLPEDARYRRVVGHGLNAQELARNRRLDSFFVKDLNQEKQLEAESCTFDAVLCAVSVQYLQWPEKVFADVFRVLRPGGVFIVSFSDRMFYQKAVSAWRENSMYGRTQLVSEYFQCVEGFTQPEIIKKIPIQGDKSPLDPILRVLGMSRSDPFNAVISYRNFKSS